MAKNNKPSKSSDIIQVTNLVKKFGDFTVVDNISFSVKQGEIFGILGPNGAGKTTTLEIIETLRHQTDGTVVVDGVDTLQEPWEVKRRMGIQIQASKFTPFDEDLMAFFNMFPAMYDVDVYPMALLKKVQLEDKAKSLANKPRIIFLDEPTTGLDPQTRLNLWEMIEEIKKEGTTFVIATNYIEEAETLCDRIAIMDGGKIIKIATPKKFINDLLDSGFKKEIIGAEATLEDVFLNLTGKRLRDE